jgi:hypothetical protein
MNSNEPQSYSLDGKELSIFLYFTIFRARIR